MSSKSSSGKPTELNAQQIRYCEFRSLGQSQTQASKSAGYATAYGGSMENRNPLIKEYISKLKMEYRESGNVSFELQCARYNEMYYEAKRVGNHKVAMEALARLDEIGGLTNKTVGGGTVNNSYTQINNHANLISGSKEMSVDDALNSLVGLLGGGGRPTLEDIAVEDTSKLPPVSKLVEQVTPKEPIDVDPVIVVKKPKLEKLPLQTLSDVERVECIEGGEEVLHSLSCAKDIPIE